MNVKQKLGVLAGSAIIAAITGCGGANTPNFSGNTPVSNLTPNTASNGASPAASSSVGVYVTDRFSDEYTHVWATVYKIEATTDGATFTTVYDNSVGATIDFSSLATTAQFLNTMTIPAGNYRATRVTFGDHITLVPSNGSASVSAPVDEKSATVAAGKAAVTINIPTAIDADKSSNLVIDFDLATFQLVNGKIKPILRLAEADKFKKDQKVTSVGGTVSDLVAGKSFKLTPANGEILTVNETSETETFDTLPGTNPELANAQKVIVMGVIDPATKVISANRIRINNQPAEGQKEDLKVAFGVVTKIDPITQSFSIVPDQAEGFQPTDGTVMISTDVHSEIHQRQSSGAFTDVTIGSQVAASGSVDGKTHTLSAKRIEILAAPSSAKPNKSVVSASPVFFG